MEEEEEEVVRRYQFLRADDEAVTREVLDRAGCGAGAKGWPAVRAGLAWLTDEAAAVRAAAAAASQTTRHPCKRSQAEEVADMLLVRGHSFVPTLDCDGPRHWVGVTMFRFS
eukprot:TRINITY_DN3520_c0_g1_i2.p2 TRINITY_DN3520_c0_g1~~TRINITY_DN3520_c0_g1_i2.p2  ORF type:complete len:112 (+),score=29.95 TRINITY_DN3520_c0_g1_i2:6-341(+)